MRACSHHGSSQPYVCYPQEVCLSLGCYHMDVPHSQSSPHKQTFVLVCSELAGWKVQLCSEVWGTQRAPGGEHALLTDYQMDEHIIWTPRRLPGGGLASPAPRCIWIYWKELAPFKGFPFMCPTPHTHHTFCQSCDGLLM